MLKNCLTFLILLCSGIAFSQSGKPFDNNNPKVTTAEAQWLNKNVPLPGFDFSGKTIDFIMVEPGSFWGREYFHGRKKMLFKEKANEYLFKVFILDSSEQARKGYDALLVFSIKKDQRKFRKSKKAEALAYSRNRYPQIAEDAGADNNHQLSLANARFFNQMFAQDHYFNHFDFTGKRVMLLEMNEYQSLPKFLKLSTYVQNIKDDLYRSGRFDPGDAYELTEAQKKQSGGYDLIINARRTKKGINVQKLLNFLEQK